MDNVEKLMKLTGNKPLGFYETPVPKVRLVSINWNDAWMYHVIPDQITDSSYDGVGSHNWTICISQGHVHFDLNYDQ